MFDGHDDDDDDDDYDDDNVCKCERQKYRYLSSPDLFIIIYALFFHG